MKKQKGFTLIELLVVIAIIAILITIVIANVGGARGRARVTAANATLKQVQVQAELDANGGDYDCSAAQVDALITSAVQEVLGDSGSSADANCQANGIIGLAVDINDALSNSGIADAGTFCVDTNGFSGPDGAADSDGTCHPI